MHPIITDFPRGVPAFWVIIFTHRLPCWIHATQSVVHHHLGACGQQKFMSHPRPPKPQPVVSQGPHVKVWDAQLYRMWPHRSGHTWSHQEWVPKLKAGICWPASNLRGSWQELCAEHAPWWTEDSQARFFFFLRGETGIHTYTSTLPLLHRQRQRKPDDHSTDHREGNNRHSQLRGSHAPRAEFWDLPEVQFSMRSAGVGAAGTAFLSFLFPCSFILKYITWWSLREITALLLVTGKSPMNTIYWNLYWVKYYLLQDVFPISPNQFRYLVEFTLDM